MLDRVKRLGRQIYDEPFIASTGAAAFVHSTWSLSVMFSGRPPNELHNWSSVAEWLYIVLPAAFIAFSVDVGQIAISADIRNGNRRKVKLIAFGALAFATYYLQWLYMVHHVPALELGLGVRFEWLEGVTFIRDIAIWIVPGFLPLATLLYTASHTSSNDTKQERNVTFSPKETQKALPEPSVKALSNGQSANGTHATRYCEAPGCNNALPANATRRKRYCSNACRQRAYNAMKTE